MFSPISEEIQLNFPDKVSSVERLDKQSGEFIPTRDIIERKYADRLDIENLYKHQAEGIKTLQEGKNLCLTTGTDSGKTLTYAIYSALQAKRNNKTTLCIYPTKSLARDQKDSLQKIYSKLKLSIEVGVYDGDTSSDRKKDLRENGDIILTNFQGLNYYLPHHESWESFYSNLGLIVIDEAHMYTGIMGSHTAWICRRLLRITETEYKSHPQIALTTATLGNPKEHAESLIGQPVTVLEKDYSPQSEKTVIFWNPIKNGETRSSPHTAVTEIAPWIVNEYEKQILVFAPSRRTTELCMNWILEQHPELSVESYHAGHTKEERRKTESRLKNGLTDIVISTNALEVGINIGEIDVVITNTYPGSRMSFQQQIGRAGRNNAQSEAIYIANQTSVDQYIIDNPDYLLDDSNVEDAVVDFKNDHIARKHLTVACSELPLSYDDIPYFTEEMEEFIIDLEKSGLLSGDLSSGMNYTGESRPESNVSIYSTSSESFSVSILSDDNTKKSLTQVNKERAYRELFEGAIYMHKGTKYTVKEFIDTENTQEIKLVESDSVDYYTQSNQTKEVTEVNSSESYPIGYGITLHRGTVTIKETYPSYTKINEETQERVEGIPTNIDDSLILNTEALWMTLEKDVSEELGERTDNNLLGLLHAYEHALIELSPTILSVDPSDLGGVSMRTHSETNKPTVFVYDGIDGGIGFSYKLYEDIGKISQIVFQRLTSCSCSTSDGCLECVMSDSCGSQNQPLNKRGAAMLARIIAKL